MQNKELNITKAHDHFFRLMITDPRVARAFFETHLPIELRDKVNLDALELQSGSYVDDLRTESIADVLFKTTIDGHAGFIYLLIDHQSRPDRWMPFRMLKYTCNVIDQHIKNTKSKKIPLVLPFVLYHGERPWSYSTSIHALVDAPKELVESYFLKPFQLIDLNRIDDEEIKHNVWLGAVELTLKHIFAKDIFPHLSDILEVLHIIKSSGDKHFVELVLVYLVDRGKVNNKEAFSTFLHSELSKEKRGDIMTIADYFRDEGKQEGKQEGIEQEKYAVAKRLFNKGIAISVIEEVTGLSWGMVQRKIQQEQSV